MTTKAELELALKDALRAGDSRRKSTLRMALAAIRLAEVEKGSSLDEPALLAVLHKEIKTRRESIEDAQRAKRTDLEAEAQAEIAVLEAFLPKAFSMDELEELARQVVQEVGATSIREMGRVMKELMPKLQGKATGDQASQVVRKLLQ